MKALFSGSFDPVTLGHLDIIRRTAPMFDTVYVTVFVNPAKKTLFTLDQRREMLDLACEGIGNIIADCSEGLVADYAKKNGIGVILKGIRNAADLEYENAMATVNAKLLPGLETIYLPASPELQHCSSSIVRELLSYGRSISGYVPENVEKYIIRKI